MKELRQQATKVFSIVERTPPGKFEACGSCGVTGVSVVNAPGTMWHNTTNCCGDELVMVEL